MRGWMMAGILVWTGCAPAAVLTPTAEASAVVTATAGTPVAGSSTGLTQAQVLEAYYSQVVNQGDYDRIDSLFDEAFETDAAFPGMKKGREGLKGFLRLLRNAFPDAKLELLERVSVGDMSVCRYRFSGTQTGKFLNIRPTKKKATVTGIDLWQFKDGKVAVQHGNFDSLGLLVQLGIVPELK
jgi:predicted ester cyclase